jgi:hypothetical protein
MHAEASIMRLFVAIAIGAVSLAGVAVAQEEGSGTTSESGVPTTVEGGSKTFKEGGQEIGEGFRGVGRGVKKVFTGQRSREDFEEGKKIGTGFRDIGRGTAGVARGVGRDVKKGFKGEGDVSSDEAESDDAEGR